MILLKKVEPADIDTLVYLSRKTFFDAFLHLNNPDDMQAYADIALTSGQLLSEINNAYSAFYFALFDNEAIGYIKLNYAGAQTELQDEKSVEVERIYVLNTHQGRQTGKQMLNHAIALAHNNKLKYIWLGVWEHNYNAIRFYEQQGFKTFGSHKFVLGNDRQTDLLMKRDL